MFEVSKNLITFPHVFPGSKLGEKQYTFNDVNGGITRIAQLGIERNSFYGGAVIALGFIKELGFYICPHFQSQVVLGFYIHDPSTVTDYGKKMLAQRVPGVEIKYEYYTTETLTPAQVRERQEEKKRYMEMGVSPEVASHATAEQLKVMVRAMEANAKSPELRRSFIEEGDSTMSAPYEPDPEVYNLGVIAAGQPGIDEKQMAASMMKESRKK